MKIVLNPADKNFKPSLAELHDATGTSEPTEYQVTFRGGIITTRRLRMQGDNLFALSADGLHEIVMPISEVGNIAVVWLPKSLLCIIAPSRSNGTTSCAILGVHPTQEAAEWHALDYFNDLGFKAANYSELLLAIRKHQQYDIVLESV